MTDHLDALEQRIESLENIVFGNSDKDSLYPKDVQSDLKCIETLTSVHQQTLEAVKGKKRIAETYKRLSELQKFLDPGYIDETTLSDAARIEIILADRKAKLAQMMHIHVNRGKNLASDAEKEFLQKTADQLKDVDEMKDVLDSEHLKSAHVYSDKLHSLCHIQIKQQDDTAQLNDETRKLLATYNNIITLISKQFVQWDELLTKLEKSQQK